MYERDVIILKFLKVLDTRKRTITDQTSNIYSDVQIYKQNDSLLVDVITDKQNEFIQRFKRITNRSITFKKTNIISFSGEFIFTYDMFENVENKNFYLHLTLFSYLLLNLQYIIVINEFSNASTSNELLKLRFLTNKKLNCTIRNGKKKDGTRVIFASISNCENEAIKDDFITHLWIIITKYFNEKQSLLDKHKEYYNPKEFTQFKKRFLKVSSIDNKQNLSSRFVSLYNSRNPNKPPLNYTTNVQPPYRWHCIKIREKGNNIDGLKQVWDWSRYFFESSSTFNEDDPDFVYTNILERVDNKLKLESVEQFGKDMRVFIKEKEYTIKEINDNQITLDKNVEDVDGVLYRKVQYMVWPRLEDGINYSLPNIKKELEREGSLILFADTSKISFAKKKLFFLNLAKPNYAPAGTEISPIFHRVQADADNEIKQYYFGDIIETHLLIKFLLKKVFPTFYYYYKKIYF